MLRTFLVIVILSSLIISNGNLYEPKWLNHQIGKMQTCSIIKCAPQTCRIRCVPNLTTTTITPTTSTTTTTMSTITSTTTTVIPTAVTWTTAISTTNTKADYTENQEVILVFFFKMKFLFHYCCNFYFHSRKNQNILVYGCHLPIHMGNLN